MSRIVRWVALLCCVNATAGLLCYNCSGTQVRWNQCAGDFAPPFRPFNNSRLFLSNCTGENAMCFVRSWRARAKPAWIVQRGCYKATKEDPVPHAVNSPKRAMTCKHIRLPEAEYRVCLCQANWCNSALSRFVPFTLYLIFSLLVLTCVSNLCSLTF